MWKFSILHEAAHIVSFMRHPCFIFICVVTQLMTFYWFIRHPIIAVGITSNTTNSQYEGILTECQKALLQYYYPVQIQNLQTFVQQQ
jgi:hypothetical protein